MSYFYIRSVIPLIMRDQLGGCFKMYWVMTFQKIDQSCRIILTSKKYINPSLNLFRFDYSIQQFLLEQNLLQIQYSLFMRNLLPYLHQRNPIMRCKLLPTIITLYILLHKFNNLRNLNFHILTNFSHKHYFQLESLRMRLRPYKTRRDNLNFVQSFYFLQQHSQHLLAFTIAVYPGWSLESLAISTVVYIVAFKQFLLLEGFYCACWANRAHIWDELYTAEWAQNSRFVLNHFFQLYTFIMCMEMQYFLMVIIYIRLYYIQTNMSINIQNPKNPNPQNKAPKFAFIFQHIILLFFIIILTRQSQPINMNFRVKTTSTLNRKRIQIKSLHQLLKPNTVIAVPEDNLSEKIFHNSIIREKEGQGSKKPILKVRSKFEKYEDYGEKLGKFRSTGSKGSLMNTSRELVDLEKSNQLKKRATMPHFRYRSLDLEQRKETRTAKNPMWTAVHYEYSNPLQKPNQKQKNQQKHSSQRILPLPKQQYLKKGSNINKRVVINLLKLKLYKNTQQQAELEPDNNTIRNNEILQMIKIYKGYGQGDHRAGIDNKGGISLSRNRRRIEQMYRSQKENGLEIKQFPFRNLNIELSVSAWRNRRNDGVPGSPPTSQLGIQ